MIIIIIIIMIIISIVVMMIIMEMLSIITIIILLFFVYARHAVSRFVQLHFRSYLNHPKDDIQKLFDLVKSGMKLQSALRSMYLFKM